MSKTIEYTASDYDIKIEDGGELGEYAITVPFHIHELMCAEIEGREPKSYKNIDSPVTTFLDFENLIHMVRDIERLSVK